MIETFDDNVFLIEAIIKRFFRVINFLCTRPPTFPHCEHLSFCVLLCIQWCLTVLCSLYWRTPSSLKLDLHLAASGKFPKHSECTIIRHAEHFRRTPCFYKEKIHVNVITHIVKITVATSHLENMSKLNSSQDLLVNKKYNLKLLDTVNLEKISKTYFEWRQI